MVCSFIVKLGRDKCPLPSMSGYVITLSASTDGQGRSMHVAGGEAQSLVIRSIAAAIGSADCHCGVGRTAVAHGRGLPICNNHAHSPGFSRITRRIRIGNPPNRTSTIRLCAIWETVQGGVLIKSDIVPGIRAVFSYSSAVSMSQRIWLPF